MTEARFLVSRIGPELFLTDIGSVRQVVANSRVTPIPEAPAFLEGVIVLDGTPVAVVDLRKRLFPEAEGAPDPLVMIVSTDLGLLGLRVDDVRRAVVLPLDALLPPPPVVAGLAGDLLVAVANIGDTLHLVLDVERVLTTSERGQLEGATAAPAGP
jgi:purine-binding chemotaxis protein CheW